MVRFIYLIWSWAYFLTDIFMIFLFMLKIYRDVVTMYFSAVLLFCQIIAMDKFSKFHTHRHKNTFSSYYVTLQSAHTKLSLWHICRPIAKRICDTKNLKKPDLPHEFVDFRD